MNFSNFSNCLGNKNCYSSGFGSISICIVFHGGCFKMSCTQVTEWRKDYILDLGSLLLFMGAILFKLIHATKQTNNLESVEGLIYVDIYVRSLLSLTIFCCYWLLCLMHSLSMYKLLIKGSPSSTYQTQARMKQESWQKRCSILYNSFCYFSFKNGSLSRVDPCLIFLIKKVEHSNYIRWSVARWFELVTLFWVWMGC